MLDRLPLTAHGKVDRRALPAFDFDKAGAAAAGRRPQSEIEKRVHATWCELFGLDELDLRAPSSSAIGGHSLLAAQLLARLHQQFRLDLPLRTIYEHPSIAAMARLIERLLLDRLLPAVAGAFPGSAADLRATRSGAAPAWNDEAIRPLPPGAAAPLSYGQKRLFFLHLLRARRGDLQHRLLARAARPARPRRARAGARTKSRAATPSCAPAT